MVNVLLYKHNSKGFFKYKDCKWIHEKLHTCTIFIIYKCKDKTSLNYCTCALYKVFFYVLHIKSSFFVLEFTNSSAIIMLDIISSKFLLSPSKESPLRLWLQTHPLRISCWDLCPCSSRWCSARRLPPWPLRCLGWVWMAAADLFCSCVPVEKVALLGKNLDAAFVVW